MRTLIALSLTALAGTLAPTSALALDDTGGTACQPLPGMPWLGSFKFVDGQLQPCVGESASGGEVVVTKLPTFGKEAVFIESSHPKQPAKERTEPRRPACPAFGCLRGGRFGGPDRDLFGAPGGGRGSGGGAAPAKKTKPQTPLEARCQKLHGDAMFGEPIPRADSDPLGEGERQAIDQMVKSLKSSARVLALSIAHAKPDSPLLTYFNEALMETHLLIRMQKRRLGAHAARTEFMKKGCEQVLGIKV